MNEPFFVLAGAVIGIFTGLVPGIHVNTISLLVLAFTDSGDFNLVLLIVSMSIVHTFVDFVPSVLLGAPDSDSFLSILPGHRYLMKGVGVKAVKLTVFGGLLGGMVSVGFIPLYFLFISRNAKAITFVIPFVLVSVLGLMVLKEETKKKKIRAVTVIFFSSVLGLLVLKNNFVQVPVFFLVIGFFAIPTLLFSLKSSKTIPKQKIARNQYGKGTVLHGSLLSFFGGAIVSVFPSIGPNQAAFIISNFLERIKTGKYLVLLGGINTTNMVFSFIVLYALGKTRTGSAAAIKELMQLNSLQMLLIIATVVFCLGFGAIATKLIAEKLANAFSLMNYRKMNLSVLFFLLLLVFFFGGFKGILVSLTASSIGLLSILWGTKRTNSMAFLMVPTIVYYFWGV